MANENERINELCDNMAMAQCGRLYDNLSQERREVIYHHAVRQIRIERPREVFPEKVKA